MTIDVARLRELHQPMYGHTGDPCSWCREWTPCPVTELLDAYEDRDRLRAALALAVSMVKGGEDFHVTGCEGCDSIKRALEGRE